MRRTVASAPTPTPASAHSSEARSYDSPNEKPAQSHTGRSRSRSALSSHHIFSGLVLVLVVVLQLLAPRLPLDIVRFFTTKQHWHVTSPAVSLRESPFFNDPAVCPKSSHKVEIAGTFNKDTERSMALAEQAKRVAAEFDFGPDAVNKAVHEFIREMGTSGCAFVWQLTAG